MACLLGCYYVPGINDNQDHSQVTDTTIRINGPKSQSKHQIDGLVVNYGISNTIVLEIS